MRARRAASRRDRSAACVRACHVCASVREQLILFSRSKICLYNKKKKINKVKPKEYQVEAVHKVATEWYSGCRLVWVKLDGT
jgi:hypothetical protein